MSRPWQQRATTTVPTYLSEHCAGRAHAGGASNDAICNSPHRVLRMAGTLQQACELRLPIRRRQALVRGLQTERFPRSLHAHLAARLQRWTPGAAPCHGDVRNGLSPGCADLPSAPWVLHRHCPPSTKATGPMQLGRLKSAPVLVDWPQIPCGLRSAVVLVSRDRRVRACSLTHATAPCAWRRFVRGQFDCIAMRCA